MSAFGAPGSEGGAPWVRPAMVIAHRGASGYLPEHTLEAYALAYGMGADMLEPDLVATRDGVLICLHDIHLERVTDVATRFPERARPDGRFYALDFSLDEIRALSATGGTRHGFQGATIPTFQEFLALIAHLNERTGREVGIVPELKSPSFHRESKSPQESAYVQALHEAGYHRLGSRCVTQCFEGDALVRLRAAGIESCMLRLLGKEAPSDSELDEIRQYAEAIGPPKAMVEDADARLMERTRARGLAVVPYTFKDDESETRRFFESHDVDGVFTDFPDVALRVRP